MFIVHHRLGIFFIADATLARSIGGLFARVADDVASGTSKKVDGMGNERPRA
ncbi:hypothetical protein [Reyranella sp.]|uniref:hypothetical protein n=1 Tax=Reyranella sp. TaxID=1929291 RepID=UPI003BAAAF42